MHNDAGDIIGTLVEPSTFTGNIPDTGVGTMSASGTFTFTEEGTVLEGFVEGTSDKGGAFLGPLAGVQGSWLNRVAALYVEGGSVYFLTGDAPGTLTDTEFSMSGSLGKSAAVGTIPGALAVSYGDTPQFFPSYTPFIISNSGIDISPNYFMGVAPTLITNEGRKVAAIGNIYTGSYAHVTGPPFPYFGYAGLYEYALGFLGYSHDTTNKKFTVDMLLQSISYNESLHEAYLGMYSMRYLGTYNDASPNYFRMAGAGTYEGTPLKFVSRVNAWLFHYPSAWSPPGSGSLYGLMGGTGTLWTGSAVPTTMIAEYNVGDGRPRIWNTNIYSYNYNNSTYTTYDGGAYKGYFGGLIANDDLLGRVVSIYISPQSGGKYTAGYLSGNFSGTAYPAITMAGMSGSLTTTPKNADIGITPSSLTSSVLTYDNSGWSKYLKGTFTGGGSITANDSGSWNYTMAIKNDTAHQVEPWGIYSMSLGGSYSTPQSTWSGVVAGSGKYGAFYAAGFVSEDTYYYANIANGTWANNKIDGDVTGRFMGHTKMGTITGNVLGSYYPTDTSWQAVNIGTWQGNPLAFMNYGSTDLTYYNGTTTLNDGFVGYFMGGTTSIFGSSPAITVIGEYGIPANPTKSHLWDVAVNSYNVLTGASTTYDSSPGAYKGYFSGVTFPGSGTDTLLGKFIALYVDGSGNAGYMTSSLTGTGYPSLGGTQGAFFMDGTISRMQKALSTGISASSLDSSIWMRSYGPDIFNYFTSGAFLNGTTDEGHMKGKFNLSSMSLVNYATYVAQNWGVYDMTINGIFSNPGSRTTWHSVAGGEGMFGAYNLSTMTGKRYLYNDNGYYGYNYYNSTPGHDVVGYVSYRQPGALKGYEASYYTGGGISYINFAYGDPYGYGRSYWYFTNTDIPTGAPTGWTGSIADALDAATPGGYTSSVGPGPGRGEGDFFVASGTGSLDSGEKISGSLSGRYIGRTQMGTLTGDILGAINTTPDTYQAFSQGTWQGTALQFRNGFLGYSYYAKNSDGVYDAYDDYGYMWFNMGGISPLFGDSTSAEATAIGEYGPGNHTLNHIWYGGWLPFNYIDSAYTTYDGGSFRGYIAGVNIVGSTTDTMTSKAYAMYVDASGKTGVLYGNMPGTGYPESMVFEADGTITRTELSTGMPFAPKDILANTQTALGPVTTDNVNIPPYGHTRSEGGFLDANFTKLGDMTYRWDRTEILAFIEPYNTTYGFGVWKTNSLGAYNASISPTYFHWSSDQIWTDVDYVTRFLKIDGYGTWSGGKLTSMETSGYWANWSSGRTALMAGQTMGVYNDSEGAFSAYSMGTWFGTPIYMQLASDAAGRQKLAALGFPSEPTTTVTLSGSQPSLSGTDVTLPISIYSFATPPSAFARKVAASNSVSGTYNGQILPYVGSIIVTNPGETFFGQFYIPRADYSSYSDTYNWIGKLWGQGAIAVGSSYIQGDLDGFGAGTYTTYINGTTSGTFSGSLAGEFFPVSNMSWITPPYDANRTKLYYYNGTNLLEDGYFKGVLDGNGPPDIWHSSESQPLDISMIGIYKNQSDVRTSPTYSSHTFGGEIYSKNYTNNTDTTTDGGAYWGILVGIQRDYSAIDGGGKSIGGFVGGLYISPTGKTGALLGYFGEVGDDYDNGWFDPNNAQWQADGKWYAVELGESAIAPSQLTSYIDNHLFYFDTSTSGGAFDTSGNITMASQSQWVESFWISDAHDAGLWGTKFYGSYSDPSGGTNDWQFEVKGAASTTDDMGVLISGGPWQNKKFEGSAVGYWASIGDITGTGVLAGRVIGTFDATASRYMAVAMGSWLETNTFLAMAGTDAGKAKLQQLGIPAVQVGSADLKGTASGIDMSGSYGMNEVKFFAATNGGKPQIWATNSVSGSYLSSPVGVSVPLSGGGLTANFAMQQLNTNKWLATVNGSGTLTGGGIPTTYTSSSIQFKGAGAGTYTGTTTNGTFTGTAAGHAK